MPTAPAPTQSADTPPVPPPVPQTDPTAPPEPTPAPQPTPEPPSIEVGIEILKPGFTGSVDLTVPGDVGTITGQLLVEHQLDPKPGRVKGAPLGYENWERPLPNAKWKAWGRRVGHPTEGILLGEGKSDGSGNFTVTLEKMPIDPPGTRSHRAEYCYIALDADVQRSLSTYRHQLSGVPAVKELAATREKLNSYPKQFFDQLCELDVEDPQDERFLRQMSALHLLRYSMGILSMYRFRLGAHRTRLVMALEDIVSSFINAVFQVVAISKTVLGAPQEKLGSLLKNIAATVDNSPWYMKPFEIAIKTLVYGAQAVVKMAGQLLQYLDDLCQPLLKSGVVKHKGLIEGATAEWKYLAELSEQCFQRFIREDDWKKQLGLVLAHQLSWLLEILLRIGRVLLRVLAAVICMLFRFLIYILIRGTKLFLDTARIGAKSAWPYIDDYGGKLSQWVQKALAADAQKFKARVVSVLGEGLEETLDYEVVQILNAAFIVLFGWMFELAEWMEEAVSGKLGETQLGEFKRNWARFLPNVENFDLLSSYILEDAYEQSLACRTPKDWKAATKAISDSEKQILKENQEVGATFKEMEDWSALLQLIAAAVQAIVIGVGILGKKGVKLVITRFARVSWIGQITIAFDKISDFAVALTAVVDLIVVRVPILVYEITEVALSIVRGGANAMAVYKHKD